MESLATHSLSVFYPWLIHTGPGAVLASGIRLGLGSGDALPIGVSSDGLLIYSPDNYPTTIGSQATMPRAVVVADAHGVLQPALYSKLTADFSNNTVVATQVPSFGVALEPDAAYRFIMRLYARSAATATGVQLQLSGPSGQIDDLAYRISHPSVTALGTSGVRSQHFNALASNFAATDAPVANSTFIIEVEGMVSTIPVTAPVTNMGVMLASEVAASNVTFKKGSFMAFYKL